MRLQSLPSMSMSSATQGTKDFITNMGLGMIADQLADLKLGELLDTPPPGLDEAVAIAKVGSALLCTLMVAMLSGFLPCLD